MTAELLHSYRRNVSVLGGSKFGASSLRTLLEKPRKLPYRMSPAKVIIDNMQSSQLSAWL